MISHSESREGLWLQPPNYYSALRTLCYTKKEEEQENFCQI